MKKYPTRLLYSKIRFSLFLFIAFLCPLLLSCSANSEGSSSISIALPSSSSSRAITSEGSLYSATSTVPSIYTVTLRDEDLSEVEKFTNVAAGTTLTIDSLRPGNYQVAIRAYIVDQTGANLANYGVTEVHVEKGQQASAKVTLGSLPPTPCIVEGPAEDGLQAATMNGTIKGENGDSYTVDNVANKFDSINNPYVNDYNWFKIENFFFEPGIRYTLSVTIMENPADPSPSSYTKSAVAGKNGIVFWL